MGIKIDLGPVVAVGKGEWSPDVTYRRANMVRYNSGGWICQVDSSTGVEPTEDSTDWFLMAKDWSSVTSFNGMKGDVSFTIPTQVSATDTSAGIGGITTAPQIGQQNHVWTGSGWQYIDPGVKLVKWS